MKKVCPSGLMPSLHRGAGGRRQLAAPGWALVRPEGLRTTLPPATAQVQVRPPSPHAAPSTLRIHVLPRETRVSRWTGCSRAEGFSPPGINEGSG